MTTVTHTDTDVVIVGGGLTGSVMAALLARENFQVTVIEARGDKREDFAGDPRALAITPASRHILQAAGCWDKLLKDSVGTFNDMHVWDAAGSGSIHFAAVDLCQPTLGYIIQQDVLEKTLSATLHQQANINWYQPALLERIDPSETAINVHLNDGRRLSATLAIAADGARSRLRELAGIANNTHDYQQTAVACLVTTERPHDNAARQCFLADGPLAFLPMAESNRCGIVWSTTPDHADELMAMPEQAFNATLAKALDYHAGDIHKSELRMQYPLQHAQAGRYCGTRVALIGDAAHTVHPLAGQGANLGLLDAASLAEVLVAARGKQRDIGLYSILRRYERWRRGENLLMLRVLQGFKLLFENPWRPVHILRNRGLDLTDAMPVVKNRIMARAMGLTGDLPEYARPVSA